MMMSSLDLQRRLRAVGLYHGMLDGDIGPLTRTAIRQFQAANNLTADGAIDGAVEALLARVPLPVNVVPPWLQSMRDHLELAETPGSGSNPEILNLAKVVARADPRLAWISGFYDDDTIPWCGLMEAFCMVDAGQLPPVPNPLSARAWGSWGIALARPIPGAVLVFSRPGGGHVGLYEAEDETHYLVIAGNQGDRVCKTRISKDRILKDDQNVPIGVRWPARVPVPAHARPVVLEAAGQPLQVNEA